ncbi:DUF4091 domain-containing protein [Chitinophaga nivalis]|uniref:DUF4091 domain-containing protein n=1 Tax=Chitinophaga nivalis TaxID=2991709 RepID=A0ABT3IST1_9BACT|nr:DUF4091 domain-containing protein [Chitinophaga nivalis]MCW3463277.1 DUF4091 domain-containing protein [Chitinophaga nivalis]MCW3487033.1 DUF4091 domain-containing protein [Chitinophaga nivalis]
MVNKFFGVLAIMLVLQQNVWAQASPAGDYQELPDPRPVNAASWEAVKDTQLHIAFGTPDTRYEKSNAPAASSLTATWHAKAWKGERIHTQLVIWSAVSQPAVSMQATFLQHANGHKIAANAISTGFVRYVMTDELNKDGSGCGYRKSKDFDSSLVADGIDIIRQKNIAAKNTQPVWLSIQVPANTPEGVYKGAIQVKTATATITLPYQVEVLNRTLPAAKDWQFHLDLWQSPDAVARVYNVKPWSDAHFKAMKPYMKMLAAAGQKVITATLIYDPWNSQTEDIYSTMVKWTKKKNGTWSYDYTVFDKWVQFMMELGIRKEINCYSMIPWNLRFYYYDEATAKDTFIVAKPGTPAYTAHWQPMLQDFVKHLKAKGWFDITAIAMDERPMEDMQQALSLIRQADPRLKVSLAGSYHAPLAYEIHDYCIAVGDSFPAAVMATRLKQGLPTTFYTCCTEGYPNTFTFSPPAEATWMGWHAAHKGYTGYLRWAYNCWVKEPLLDSRFRAWAAGDTYFVYPGPRSSIRFERLVEGIQDFEKIRLLKAEFIRTNNQAALAKLEKMLQPFEAPALKTIPAATMLQPAKDMLNGW